MSIISPNRKNNNIDFGSEIAECFIYFCSDGYVIYHE